MKGFGATVTVGLGVVLILVLATFAAKNWHRKNMEADRLATIFVDDANFPKLTDKQEKVLRAAFDEYFPPIRDSSKAQTICIPPVTADEEKIAPQMKSLVGNHNHDLTANVARYGKNPQLFPLLKGDKYRRVSLGLLSAENNTGTLSFQTSDDWHDPSCFAWVEVATPVVSGDEAVVFLKHLGGQLNFSGCHEKIYYYRKSVDKSLGNRWGWRLINVASESCQIVY